MTNRTAVPVLVTGGAGYIGSHTCKALAAAGYLPVTLDNLSLGHRWAVQWGPLVEAELLDADAVQRALREHGIKAVIHFAASAYVGDSMRDPAWYYRNNVLTTLVLLDAMRSAGVKDIIFSSSCSVYGNPAHVPIDETHATGPLSPYGQSKLDGENALRWYGMAYGIRWIALRYFNAAGADAECDTGEDHEPETRIVPRAIMAAMGAVPELQVFGNDFPTRDGTCIRDYIHVSDLARAHVSALNALGNGTPSQVLNLGTGRGYSVREVLQAVELAVGRKVPHSDAPRRPGDPAEVVADARRAESVLDWSARESDLATIVATAARWHAKHKGSAHNA
jgi:UDP-glucose-4-epimerase GalE